MGGRETFLVTYLAALRALGVSADLLAARVADHAAGLDCFGATTACGSGTDASTLRNWLEKGEAAVRARRPDVLWAQHYELLPAWLLATSHGIPLLTTFHGPLTGAGRPNSLMNALGMTLAVSRGAMVSAVSAEAANSLGDGPPRDVVLIPNAVDWQAAGPARRGAGIRRVACLARTSKTGHLRAAVELFAKCTRLCDAREMSVAGGILPREEGAGRITRAAAAGRIVGFKWALDRKLLATLARVRFPGVVADPMRFIGEYDAVFGMGRVVIEALAAGKPAVLIGYDHVVDVIDGANFDRFAEANFSGRGEAAADLDTVARRLNAPSSEPLSPEQIERYSVSAQAPRLFELLRTTAERGVHADRDLARELCDAIRRGVRDDGIFETACAALSGGEIRMLYRFATG